MSPTAGWWWMASTTAAANILALCASASFPPSALHSSDGNPLRHLHHHRQHRGRQLVVGECDLSGCFGQSCDYWTSDGDHTCDELESRWECECSGCACATPVASAVVPDRAAGRYAYVVGATCDDAGLAAVQSASECADAAERLQLDDVTPWTFASASCPGGCFTSSFTWQGLYFNTYGADYDAEACQDPDFVGAVCARAACEDSPADWTSQAGYSCADVVDQGLCNGDASATVSRYAVLATDACCGCGGGFAAERFGLPTTAVPVVVVTPPTTTAPAVVVGVSEPLTTGVPLTSSSTTQEHDARTRGGGKPAAATKPMPPTKGNPKVPPPPPRTTATTAAVATVAGGCAGDACDQKACSAGAAQEDCQLATSRFFGLTSMRCSSSSGMDGGHCCNLNLCNDNKGATTDDDDDDDDANCPATCLQGLSCDFWNEFSDDLTCDVLASKLGCECAGCACKPGVQWRFVVDAVLDGGAVLQLTEASFVDDDGNGLLGGVPHVTPPVDASSSSSSDPANLNNGDCAQADVVACSPLPCSITYTLYGDEPPAAVALGMGETASGWPRSVSVQVFDDALQAFQTLWHGAPALPCDYDAGDGACTALTIIRIPRLSTSTTTTTTATSGDCPLTCMEAPGAADAAYNCDHWIGIADEFSCETLERSFDCDCRGCACVPVASGDGGNNNADCDWWSCKSTAS